MLFLEHSVTGDWLGNSRVTPEWAKDNGFGTGNPCRKEWAAALYVSSHSATSAMLMKAVLTAMPDLVWDWVGPVAA